MSTTSEPRIPIGVPYIITEIPAGKQLKFVDGICIDTSVIPHKVMLEDIPLTQVELLERRLESAQDAIDFLVMQNMGGM